jgi:hypothetical protein
MVQTGWRPPSTFNAVDKGALSQRKSDLGVMLANVSTCSRSEE